MFLTGDTFYGSRLQLAREFRQLTQQELANRVVASNALISQYEAGKKRSPSPDLVAALASVLGFAPGFFYQPVDDSFLRDECSFRHQRAASERLKTQIRAHATLLGLVVERLREHLRFPPLNLPAIPATTWEGIENAADATRQHWGLGLDAPLMHAGRILENAGVLIVPHLVRSKEIDAFSRQGPTTVIFLNQAIQSTSRWIFDIGHECGHLVMHAKIPTGTVETEDAADYYAGAFLMPRRAFSRDFGPTGREFSWKHIFDLKRHWRVSAASIVRRAHQLDLIGPVEYRRAFQYMSLKRWRSNGEPYEPAFQKPELLLGALNALGSDVDLTIAELCADLNFEPQTFEEVTGMKVPTAPARPVTVMAPRSKIV
jgi:Zn-dependent peptidase ImmA (M78 family)/transcriptional regulator with XRE-family HTH domain